MQEHIYYNALNILFDGAIISLEKECQKYKTYKEAWLQQNNQDIDPELEYKKLEDLGIKLILDTDKEYPTLLKEISHNPKGIYAKGNISLLTQNKSIPLAIVGSRNMTSYGQKVCEKLIKDLSLYNFIIISGLAYGIDTCAHKQALINNLKTIAILGSGLENIYPTTNKLLSEKIIQDGGLLISEFPISSSPAAFHFPQRNRIISGLSKGILIIEAQEKSGSLITAKFALDQNRELFAIPNSIFEKNSNGVNKLIQSGAKLISEIKDILDEFNINITQESIFQEYNLTENEKQIFDFIQKEDSVDLDFIKENIKNLQINEILANLTSLELKGLISESNGIYSLAN